MLKPGTIVRVKGTQSPSNPSKLARGKIMSSGEFQGRTVYDVMVRLKSGLMRMSFLPETDLEVEKARG